MSWDLVAFVAAVVLLAADLIALRRVWVAPPDRSRPPAEMSVWDPGEDP